MCGLIDAAKPSLQMVVYFCESLLDLLNAVQKIV